MSKQSRTKIKKEVPELNLLFEISSILESSMDIRDVVEPVVQAISEHTIMRHGTLTLHDRTTGEINIMAAHGLSSDQRQKGSYKPGQGITGKVFQTGKAVSIIKISQEKTFLNLTGVKANQNEELSFVCVPIKLGTDTIGTLSVYLPFDIDHNLNEESRLLRVIASMMAQAVKMRQTAMEDRQRLLDENERLQSQLKDRFRPDNIIGNSQAMQDCYDLIGQVSQSNATVLIMGESGTGKELVSQAIHFNSLRSNKPFIKVNCAALPNSMLESELFGHEKGAFTGAIATRKGRFELANGGTLFLDEIGEISQDLQVKLLRVLQEKEFERVGGMHTVKVDVRIITATNRALEKHVAEGTFRDDLFYRLNVFPIHLPPLRERRTDILQLANHFIEKFNKENLKDVRRISTPAIDMMMAYHWPGNVRELENCIERAMLLTSDDVIHGHHLPATLQTAEASDTADKSTLDMTMANVERELIIEALKRTRGNMAKAADSLGITERIMGLRVKKYAISYKRYRV